MPQAVALLASALPLAADGAAVHLVPAGEFAGRDGRPGPGRTWKLSDERGRALAQRMTTLHAKVAFNFDYEHQQTLAEKNGQPAPAAGWASRFEWRDGQGLYALEPKWTERASAFLKADEYRYISPAILYDTDTGAVNGLVNASLVNIPALDSLAPVMARLSAQFSSFNPQEPSPMNPVLKALLAALGLADTATEADATSAVAALRAQANRADQLNQEVATLKAATPDAAKYVTVERFNAVSGELAALKSAQAEAEVAKVIDEAKAAGKVVSEAIESTWRDIGKSDLATLKKLVEGTPANPALAGRQQTGGKNPGGDGGAGDPGPEALAICRAMGMDAATFAKGAD